MQGTETLARYGKRRIRDGGGNGRHSDFSDAAGLLATADEFNRHVANVSQKRKAQFPQPHRGRQTALVRCRPTHRRRQTKNKAALYLLPGNIRIDLRAAIDRSDNAPDAQPVLIDAGLHQNGDMAARSEEHTSELQSLMRISYAVFCLKKKKTNIIYINNNHVDHQCKNNTM